jgi:DeoR/GlpR family transcriptional regulator of sugar metabolism
LFGDERQEEILALIRQEKRVSVSSLADRFAVVGETIRVRLHRGRKHHQLPRRGAAR